MTYSAGHEDLRLEGDYVKLEADVDGEGRDHCQEETSLSSGGCWVHGGGGRWCWSLCWWAKLGLLLIFAGVLGAVFFKWVGPFLMDKEMIPIIIWERETFNRMQLGLIIFGTLALFPRLLLPSSPSMRVAGMTFGYGYGFFLVIGGVAIGVSLPYFIGSLFYHKIQAWLARYPKRASVIRLAGREVYFISSELWHSSGYLLPLHHI